MQVENGFNNFNTSLHFLLLYLHRQPSQVSLYTINFKLKWSDCVFEFKSCFLHSLISCKQSRADSSKAGLIWAAVSRWGCQEPLACIPEGAETGEKSQRSSIKSTGLQSRLKLLTSLWATISSDLMYYCIPHVNGHHVFPLIFLNSGGALTQGYTKEMGSTNERMTHTLSNKAAHLLAVTIQPLHWLSEHSVCQRLVCLGVKIV